MFPIADEFEYDFRGCSIRYGRGRIDELGTYLAELELGDALVVCGANVGSNDAVMDPIRAGLDERLAGVFDGSTPAKRVETAFDLLDHRDAVDADVLVAVGGGSSLDTARQATMLAADGRDYDQLRDDAMAGSETLGSLAPDTDPSIPVVVVPTTFAGADVSHGGSLEVLSAAESPTGQPVSVRGAGAMPIADVADPALFETTPRSVLAGSAMNGFNKGIETPYAADAMPVGDATAVHGLRLLSDSLPRVAGTAAEDAASATDTQSVPAAMDRAVVGALLVQLNRKMSIIHAFGHGFARRYDVQQGAIHAIVAPHVLRYLFSEVDASRRALAAGLGVHVAGRDDEAIGADVVDAVTAVRDGMGLPSRLRELDPTRQSDLEAIAEFIVDDPPMVRAPDGLDATATAIEHVLHDAW